MHNSQRILLEFVDKIYATTDIDALFDALERAITALGFDHVSYTYVPNLLNGLLSDLSPVFKTSRDYQIEFIEHYQACNFGQHDFTIKKIKQGEMAPIHWWDMAQQRQLAPEEKIIIEVARNEYGLQHGITIPVFSDGGSIAGVSVTSSEPDRLFDLLRHERITVLTSIARMFSDRALVLPKNRAQFFKPFLNALSATEKNVLTQLSQGQHLKGIAEALRLDYKYLANTVIPNLRKKFGNISRDQLMYQAGSIQFDQLID